MAFSLFSLMLKPGQAGTAVWGRGELFPLGVFYAAACKGIGETDSCLVGRTGTVSYTHLTLPTTERV